jgi:hypothetical protein
VKRKRARGDEGRGDGPDGMMRGSGWFIVHTDVQRQAILWGSKGRSGDTDECKWGPKKVPE